MAFLSREIIEEITRLIQGAVDGEDLSVDAHRLTDIRINRAMCTIAMHLDKEARNRRQPVYPILDIPFSAQKDLCERISSLFNDHKNNRSPYENVD